MPFGNVAWSWVQFVKSRLGDQNLKLFLESAFAFFLMIALSVAADQVHEVESLATSDNFRICCSQGGPPPQKVLDYCESMRRQLGKLWRNTEELPSWRPVCKVQLHNSRSTYIQAVGSIGASTLGSSLIQLDGGRTISRRIDVLVEPSGELPALPHELTHIILAECFGGNQPPHWLDEGAAMLADTKQKQLLHERDCRQALHQGTAMPLNKILNLEQFASVDQMPAFYGQSASLLRFLCQDGDLAKVTRFGMDATQHGYDQALSTHYGISSVAELERRWKNYAFNHNYENAEQSLSVFAVSFRP